MQVQLDLLLLLLPVLVLVGLAVFFRALDEAQHRLRRRYRAYRYNRERPDRYKRTLGTQFPGRAGEEAASLMASGALAKPACAHAGPEKAEPEDQARQRRELELLLLDALHALETGEPGAGRRIEAAQRALDLFERQQVNFPPVPAEEGAHLTHSNTGDGLTTTHSGSIRTVVLRPVPLPETSTGTEETTCQ